MKRMTIHNMSPEMKRLLDFARINEDVVVQTPDGHEFVISWVDDFDIELAQQRSNKELMRFLDQRFKKGRLTKGVPLEAVKRELGNKTDKRRRKAKRTAK